MRAIDLSNGAGKARAHERSSRLFDLSLMGDHSEETKLYAEVATSEEQIYAARVLHAYAYLRAGYVNENDIENRVLTAGIDPYVNRSTYFIIANNSETPRPIVVARQIAYDHTRSFPLLENMKISPSSRDVLDGIDLPNCVEISGLAKMPGASKFYTLLMYRDMWQYSIKHGHDKWFIASDERLTKSLENMFGATITRLGDTQNYLGSPTDPMLLDSRNGLEILLQECADGQEAGHILDKKTLLAILIEGLDQMLLPQEQQDLIKQVFNV